MQLTEIVRLSTSAPIVRINYSLACFILTLDLGLTNGKVEVAIDYTWRTSWSRLKKVNRLKTGVVTGISYLYLSNENPLRIDN